MKSPGEEIAPLLAERKGRKPQPGPAPEPIPAPAADVYLRDEIAESLVGMAGELPEANELLEAVRSERRLAVRGLTGSARGMLASWLQRETGRTLL